MCAKLFATVNDAARPLELESLKPGDPWQVASGDADVRETGPGLFSVLHKGKSHTVLVQKEDEGTGTVKMRVGGGTYSVKLEDERSRLVQLLGLDKLKGAVLKELKAPMPGLVLQVLVKAGDRVKKNDPLLVLEAMKMENVIKCTGDAVVRTVHAQERSAVEKGQLLLSFEQ